MAVSSHRAIAIGISAVFFILAALPAIANPLCASPEQRRTVQSTLTESPELSPAKIASATGIPEAAVVHAMPMEVRTAVNMLEFKGVWQALTEWEDALVVVPSSDSVFEVFGPLPEGETDRVISTSTAQTVPTAGTSKLIVWQQSTCCRPKAKTVRHTKWPFTISTAAAYSACTCHAMTKARYIRNRTAAFFVCGETMEPSSSAHY